REVDAHGIAVGDPVHRDQYPEHGEAQHERVAAVAQLPTPDGPDHVVPAQDDVGHDQEEATGQPGLGPPGQVRGHGGDLGADDDGEAEEREDVQELAHHALHRWLSTDWWARKSPKAVKLT